jgi:translocator protein
VPLNIGRLVSAIVICEMAGVVGSIFTISAIPTWYASLEKPGFTPPAWLFGPVWTILYLLMGISLYLLWKEGFTSSGASKAAVTTFAAQLLVNVLWSVVFFGSHLIFFGLITILILWVSIALTIAVSSRVSRKAAALLVPYILWVTVATLLNYYVWLLNP